jgi:sortase (surface protein transpeptidase)
VPVFYPKDKEPKFTRRIRNRSARGTGVPYTSAVLRSWGICVVVVAALLVALLALPAALTAETETHPSAGYPVEQTSSTAGETPKSSPKVDEKSKSSSLEKLALQKLTLEKPAPQEPTSKQNLPPNRDQSSDQNKNPEPAKASAAASTPVLPGQAQKAPAEPPPATAPSVTTPSSSGKRLLLSIPRLGLQNVTVGDSPAQSYLDREGIMHLSGTGFPYQRGSNTYIAGHAEGYNISRVPHVFRNLKDLQQGDHIFLRDATGRTYDYRV